jgi:glyoxylase-like metal-dependent hydrolase (beta-lactamase superfamily II)
MTTLQVTAICANPWRQNCFLAIDPNSGSALVIDPGYGATALEAEIQSRGAKVTAIFATHAHFDHIACVRWFQDRWQVPLLLHADDESILRRANLFAMAMKAPAIPGPDSVTFVADLEYIVAGQLELQVLHLPGHTPGSCALLGDELVFVGDVLSPVTAEASALPGYDGRQLDASIDRLLATVTGPTIAYPGHGRPRTLADLAAGRFSGSIDQMLTP